MSEIPKRSHLLQIIAKVLWISGLLVVNRFELAGNFVFLLVAAYLAIGVKNGLIKSFALVSLAPTLNTYVVQNGGPVYTAGRFAVFLIIVVLLLARSMRLGMNSNFKATIGWLIFYVVWTAFLAAASGYFVQVAFSKLALFMTGSMIVLLSVAEPIDDREELTIWCFSLFASVAGIGIAMYLIGQGYNYRGDLSELRGFFNGPFYHANTLGPLAAMAAVLLMAMLLYDRYVPKALVMLVLAAFSFFLILSKSRTGVGCALVGIAVLLYFSRKKYLQAAQIQLAIQPRSVFIGFALCLAIGFFYDIGNEQVLLKSAVRFINKDFGGQTPEEVSLEHIVSSRQSLVMDEWNNFVDNSLIGIGFGTSKSDYFQMNADVFSAPIEKGFLPVAVLEETGVSGALLFFWYLLQFFLAFLRVRNIPAAVLLVTYICVNFGEVMIFSFGGHGAFGWAIVAMAFTIDPYKSAGVAEE